MINVSCSCYTLVNVLRSLCSRIFLWFYGHDYDFSHLCRSYYYFLPLLSSNAYEQSSASGCHSLFQHCLSHIWSLMFPRNIHPYPRRRYGRRKPQQSRLASPFLSLLIFVFLLALWLAVTRRKKVHSRRLLAHDRGRRNWLIQKTDPMHASMLA